MKEEVAQDRVAALVSRETMEQFIAIESALLQWSKRFNLVAPASLSAFWARHVLDSVQLMALAPNKADQWLDLGSGAGFPGMILAILLKEQGNAKMTLVEANGKKVSFLQHCVRMTGAPVKVLQQRIEHIPAQTPDVITARAVADLSTLLSFCERLATKTTVLLLPKGKNIMNELTWAKQKWDIEVELHPSLTDEYAKILKIRKFHRV